MFVKRVPGIRQVYMHVLVNTNNICIVIIKETHTPHFISSEWIIQQRSVHLPYCPIFVNMLTCTCRDSLELMKYDSYVNDRHQTHTRPCKVGSYSCILSMSSVQWTSTSTRSPCCSWCLLREKSGYIYASNILLRIQTAVNDFM